MMVKIVRGVRGDSAVLWGCALHPLKEIANVVRTIPVDWITEDGFLPNQKFVEYVRPIVQGHAMVDEADGLPLYGRLALVRVPKLAPPFASK